jgi:hypothetical protein
VAQGIFSHQKEEVQADQPDTLRYQAQRYFILFFGEGAVGGQRDN